MAVKNHANGAMNPDAHMKKVITLEQAMAGKPIADPLNVYDCSLVSDGAASVVIAPLDRARDQRQAGARARDRANVRLCGAGSEGRYHGLPSRKTAAAKGLRDGGRRA